MEHRAQTGEPQLITRLSAGQASRALILETSRALAENGNQ
jgi:hypothetical protein